jgi:hypothetical protein
MPKIYFFVEGVRSGTESTITEAQPQMMMDDFECRAVGGMTGGGN